MSVIDTLLSDIDTAVLGSGDRRRHALLRRTTAKMIDQLADLSDRHLAIFDDVLFSLALDVETETRAELSEKLADLHRVPKKTCRALALDDAIRVAKPLIEKSPCLDEETLLAIIDKRDARFLSSVARRRTLPVAILDRLIEQADDALLIEIVQNRTTPLPDKTLRLLAERALAYQPLHKILRTRPDLANRHIGAVIEAARFRANTTMSGDEQGDDMLSRALSRETAQQLAKLSQISLASRIQSHDGLSSHSIDLDQMLERDLIDDALAALAVKAGVSNDYVKHVFHAPQYEPLMFLLRAQDYPIATLLNFLRQKHGGISPEFERQVSDAYCELARDTAKRIASFMSDKTDSADVMNIEALRHSA